MYPYWGSGRRRQRQRLDTTMMPQLRIGLSLILPGDLRYTCIWQGASVCAPPAACNENSGEFRYSPVRALYCAFVSGTTDRRPIFTNGESANRLSALICTSETGLASGPPTLIFTTGFLGSEASMETTDAVPTAVL